MPTFILYIMSNFILCEKYRLIVVANKMNKDELQRVIDIDTTQTIGTLKNNNIHRYYFNIIGSLQTNR